MAHIIRNTVTHCSGICNDHTMLFPVLLFSICPCDAIISRGSLRFFFLFKKKNYTSFLSNLSPSPSLRVMASHGIDILWHVSRFKVSECSWNLGTACVSAKSLVTPCISVQHYPLKQRNLWEKELSGNLSSNCGSFAVEISTNLLWKINS